jgi:HEAT repeat protein
VSEEAEKPKLRYQPIPAWTREEALEALASERPDRMVLALLSLAFGDEDGGFVEAICCRHARHAHVDVRGIAVECLGHLARLHEELDLAAAAPIVQAALHDDDEWVRMKADDARSEICHALGLKELA